MTLSISKGLPAALMHTQQHVEQDNMRPEDLSMVKNHDVMMGALSAVYVERESHLLHVGASNASVAEKTRVPSLGLLARMGVWAHSPVVAKSL